MVELRELKVKVAVQADDVMVLIKNLVVTIREGGDITSLVSELMTAIQGVEKIPTEAKEALFEVLASVAVHSVEIAKALVAPKVQPL